MKILWLDFLYCFTGADSGGFWEQRCERMLKEVGFELVFPAAWPSVFYHSGLGLLLAVYVDDFQMSGPEKNL